MIRRTLPASLCLAIFAALCSASPGQNLSVVSQSPAAAPPAQELPAQIEPPAVDRPYASLPAQIAILLTSPEVARDHWGILVTNLDGAPIYALNEAQLFQPASNAKLFTTAAALALLGPAKTFQTVVAITAPIKKGVLHGNLYLVGGGDANFGSQDIPYVPPAQRPRNPSPPPATIADIDDLANQIFATGLRKIEGDVLGDDSLYKWAPYPPDWSWDDLVWGYGAPVSALTVHDNELQATIAPGKSSFSPNLPYYTESDHVLVIMGKDGKRDCDSLDVSISSDTKLLTIEGALPEKAAPCAENIAITNPAEYAAFALKIALEAKGISISGSAKSWHNDAETGGRSAISAGALPGAYPGPALGNTMRGGGCIDMVSDGPIVTAIANHYSPNLAADVNFTNKASQNLHAELMLRNIALLSCENSGYPQLVKQFLTSAAGIDPNDFHLVDGSGLSSHDLVTPRATAKLLQYATTQPWFATWKASLPIGGEDGTLENRFPNPPLKDHLFAKTGTLGEARALSGYLDTASGRTVIFSIMVGNHLPGTSVDRDVMDKIVAAIQQAE